MRAPLLIVREALRRRVSVIIVIHIEIIVEKQSDVWGSIVTTRVAGWGLLCGGNFNGRNVSDTGNARPRMLR